MLSVFLLTVSDMFLRGFMTMVSTRLQCTLLFTGDFNGGKIVSFDLPGPAMLQAAKLEGKGNGCITWPI